MLHPFVLYLFNFLIYSQQSYIESATDPQISTQLSEPQERLPTQWESPSQSPKYLSQGSLSEQQLPWLDLPSQKATQQSEVEEAAGNIWWQLSEPQTRSPTQSLSELQSPPHSPHGSVGEKQESDSDFP